AERAAAAPERLARDPVSRNGSRPRLAWVSPVPPAEAAASRASAALLPALGDTFDVELVPPACSTVAREVLHGGRVIRPSELWGRQREAPFDLFVYHLDPEHPPPAVEDLMRWRSGLAIVHGPGLAESHPLIAASDGIVVHDAGEWASLRSRLSAP